MQGWMGMTDEEILLESKSKALFMAVGWNASPVGALIYAMSKYCALNNDKGYSVGPEVRGSLIKTHFAGHGASSKKVFSKKHSAREGHCFLCDCY